MEWPQDDEFGLDFVCERNGQQTTARCASGDMARNRWWPLARRNTMAVNALTEVYHVAPLDP